MKNFKVSCVALLAMLAFGTGCPEENNTTTTATEDMGNDGRVEDMSSMPEDSGEDTTGIPNMYEARYEMRFDSLKFTRETLPSKDSLVRLLNGLLKQNFDQSVENPIVILLDIKDIDTDAMTMKLRSGAGLKTVTEGEYEWHPMTPPGFVDGTISAESAEVSGEIPEFIFIATIGEGEDVMSVPLIINDLEFSATLEDADSEGLAQIQTGNLKGYMTLENGRTAQIETSPGNPVTLAEFFGEDSVDFDSDGDGTNDSWAMYATFTAVPTLID